MAPGTATSDSVYLDNARIARGEYVENALATSYYGVEFMDALNRRTIPREAFAAMPQQQIVVKVEMPKNVGQTVVNMPQRIVVADQPSVSGAIIGSKVLTTLRGVR